MCHFRNSLGRGDNPNPIEFGAAFKKLLICHPLLTSVDHNCISNATGILTVSSRCKKKSVTSLNRDKTFELELDESYEEIMVTEMGTMNPYEEHMCSYLAFCVEEKFHQNVKLFRYKCITCANVLSNVNDKINNELLQMQGQSQPSASTVKIIIFANALLGMISAQQQQGNNFNTILRIICEKFDIDDVFPEFHSLHIHAHEDEGEPNSLSHKQEFISKLIEIYLVMKSKSISRKITDVERGELIRYKRKHAYLAAGQ